MAVIIYEDVTPTLIANTTTQVRKRDGVATTYHITPISGYVLHDKESDYMGLDPETGEDVLVLGFNRGTCSCAANYDFAANPREFYAIPESEVPDPENQIFGGVSNDHEVM